MAASKPTNSALQVNDDTEMIEIASGKFKFMNSRFEKIPQKLCDYSTDLKLKIDSNVYHTHREVLVNASAYFAAMFSVDMQEKDQKTIELRDISKVGFDMLLEYFYHGHVTITPTTIGELLEASRFYQVEWVVNVCVMYMVQHLCFCDYGGALELADLFHLGDISTEAFEFLGIRFHQLIERGEASKLCFEVLLGLLQSNVFLSISECEMFSYLHENWSNHKDFGELICSLRFCLLEPECLDMIKVEKLGGEKGAEKLKLSQKYLLCPFIFEKTEEVSLQVRGSSPTLVVFSITDNVTVLKSFQFETDSFFMHTLDMSPLKSYLENCESYCVGNFHIFAGGYDYGYTSSNKVIVFDTRDFGLITLPFMLEKRVSFGFCASFSHLFAIGGINHSTESGIDQEEALNSVETFDLKLNTWKYLAPLPKAIFDISTVVHEATLYISGGTSNDLDDPIPLFDFWCLSIDEKTETPLWTSLPPMKHSRQNHAMFVWHSSIHVFGGVSVDEADNHTMAFCRHNEVFNLEKREWQDLVPTPAEFGRIYNKFAIGADDRIYLCSGCEEEKSLRCFDLLRGDWVDKFEEIVGDACSHMAILNIALKA